MKLRTLYEHFVSNKESRWIIQPYNCQALYEFIKKHPVKRILDLGTGIGASAAIIALALKDKGETDYKIDTVEQLDKCIKLAKEIIPQELQEHIIFHKSEAVLWQTEKIPHQTFSIFETTPEGEFDFILNDAPGPWLEEGHYIELPNATITKMLLEDKLKVGTYVAWDGRHVALHILERYFADNFWLVRPAQKDDFNVLERKEGGVIFKDDRLEEMKTSTYFNHFNEKDNLSSDKLNSSTEATTTS